jgi:hypothetical protein
MTHTIRFEYVQRDSEGSRIAYQQEALEAPTRLDERAILRELVSKGYRGVRCMSVAFAGAPGELQSDLDRLTRRV